LKTCRGLAVGRWFEGRESVIQMRTRGEGRGRGLEDIRGASGVSKGRPQPGQKTGGHRTCTVRGERKRS
jgi:hypothetical protein